MRMTTYFAQLDGHNPKTSGKSIEPRFHWESIAAGHRLAAAGCVCFATDGRL